MREAGRRHDLGALLVAVLALASGCERAVDDPDAAARAVADQRNARIRIEAAAKVQTDQIMREVAAEVLDKRLASLEAEVAELRREVGVAQIEAIVVRPPPAAAMPAEQPASDKPAAPASSPKTK